MKPKITHAMLEKAKHYASQSVKEGYSSEKDWNTLTKDEFIKKAQRDGDRGDLQAQAQSEDI